MSDHPGKLVFYPHPFTDEGREDFDISKETRLALLLKEKAAKGSFVVNVNGKRMPLESASMKEGDFAIVRRVPEGASSASADQQRLGGKITGWSAAAAIIGVALMFIPGAQAAGLQIFITGVAGMVTGALEYYGYSGASSSTGTSTTRPDIRGASNSASAGGKVPLILGKNRLTPYYAAMPFTDVSIGDDGKYKYLNLLFVLGYAQLKISNIRLGELLLASNSADVRNGAIACDGQYGGVSIELRQDGALPENYSYVVQEQSLSTALSRFHTLNFSVTIDATAKTITRNDGGNWGTDDVLVGDCIEMFGAANAGNNGIWIVTDATASVLTCFAVTSFVAETFTARMNVFPSNIAVSCAKTRKLGVEIEFANGLLAWNNGAKNDLDCDVRAFYRLKGAQSWTAFPSGWKGGGTILSTTTEKIWAVAKAITTSRTGKTDKPWSASESFTIYTDSTKLINIQDGYEHSGDYNFRVDPNGDNGLIVYVDGAKYTLTDSKLLLVLSTGNHTIKITYGASNTYNTGGTVYCVTGGETTSETYPWLITRAKNETLRFYAETNLLPAGQYEVMVARYTGDRDNTSSLTYVDDVTWASFKAFTEREVWEEQTRAKVAFLCVRIRASNQLANTIAQLNLIAEGVYPAYSGSGSGASAWTDAVTTNPASAFLWLIRGPFNPRPVTLASRFDWAALEMWYTHCAGNFSCNAVLSSASTAKTLLQAVCEVGRASFTLKDGLFSVAEDCAKSDIKQLITPRNSWGFSFSKSFDEIPHGLRVTFRNEDADYATDERIVLDDDYLYDIDNTGELVDAWGNAYAVGATNPATGNLYKQATKFEAVSYAYTTDPDEVFKHARFTLAVRRLRPETFTVNMDIEQLAVTRGDRVSVAHDVVSWGLDWGRVTELVKDGSGNVTSVTFDEPVPFEAGKSYAFRYRTAKGINYATFSVETTAEYSTITPDTVIPAANGLETDSLIQFGEAAIGFGDCIVVGVEQGEDYSAKLTLVEYNPAIFSAESGTIPAHDSKITKLATVASAQVAAQSSENQAPVQAESTTQASVVVAQDTADSAANAAASAASAASAANSAAVAAQTTANAAGKVWTQSSAPTIGSRPNAINGDVWYDTDDGSKYEAISGVWVLQTSDVPLDPAVYHSMDEVPEIPDDPAGVAYRETDNWNGGIDAWLVNQGTLSISSGALLLTASGNDSYISRVVSINGSTYKHIRLLVKYVGDRSSIYAFQVFYSTGSHGYTTSYYKSVQLPPIINQYFIVDLDMSVLTAGGADWTSNTITGIRFDFQNTISGALIYHKSIYIGTGAYLPGSVLDNSGHGNHGQAFAVTPVAGISGNGLSFNGTNSYVSFDITKNNSNTAFSKSFWIQGKTRTAIQYIWSRDTGASGGYGIRIYLDANNRPVFSISENGATLISAFSASGSECTSDCMLTFEYFPSGYLRIYKNGILIAENTTSIPSLAFYSASQLCVMGSLAETSGFFNGWIDEVSDYSYNLIATKVLGLYQSKSLPKVYTRTRYLADSAASDGIITPAEKYNILNLWYQIGKDTSSGSYGAARTRAIALGVSYAALDSAWNALYAYLYTSPAILAAASWNNEIQSISKTALATLESSYYAAEAALLNAISSKEGANALASANANVSTLTPKYLGIGILQGPNTASFPGYAVAEDGTITATNTVTPNVGDYMVNHVATYLALGIWIWNGSAWTQSGKNSMHMMAASSDLVSLSIGGIATPEGTVIVRLFARQVFAEDVDATGTVTGARLKSNDNLSMVSNIADDTDGFRGFTTSNAAIDEDNPVNASSIMQMANLNNVNGSVGSKTPALTIKHYVSSAAKWVLDASIYFVNILLGLVIGNDYHGLYMSFFENKLTLFKEATDNDSSTDATFETDYIITNKAITPLGGISPSIFLSGTHSYGELYNALSPLVPNIGNRRMATGFFSSNDLCGFSRVDASTIRLWCRYSAGTYSIVDITASNSSTVSMYIMA